MRWLDRYLVTQLSLFALIRPFYRLLTRFHTLNASVIVPAVGWSRFQLHLSQKHLFIKMRKSVSSFVKMEPLIYLLLLTDAWYSQTFPRLLLAVFISPSLFPFLLFPPPQLPPDILPAELPPCDLTHLSHLSGLLQSGREDIPRRESVVAALVSGDYLRQLMKVFHEAEEQRVGASGGEGWRF